MEEPGSTASRSCIMMYVQSPFGMPMKLNSSGAKEAVLGVPLPPLLLSPWRAALLLTSSRSSGTRSRAGSEARVCLPWRGSCGGGGG